MEQVQHSLSRLALARAIKSTDNESEEVWNKSIIFNQPFVKDLHRQRHQLSRQLEKPNELQESRHGLSTPNFKRHHYHHHKASSSSGSSLSLTLEKRPSAPKSIRQSQRTCLPSDTEEDESDDGHIEDDETDDGSEVFQVKRQLDPIKKSRSPLLNQNGISRPVSMESSSRTESGVSSPSRNSTSSHVTPLTEEDEVEEPIIHHSQQNIPQHVLNEEFPNYIPMQQMPKSPAPLTPPMMVDPMYYQRLHHYQTQLQFQQQLQYQQQQLYLLSQNSSVFFPPGSKAMMMTDEPISMGPLPPPPPHHMPSSSSHRRMTHPHHHHHHKHRHYSSSSSSRLSSTDIRRRQEILKSSTMDWTSPSSASLSMNGYNMAMPMAPSIPRNSGGRRPSYF